MELCDDGHDQVCFETRICPACQMKDERDGLLEDIEKLEKKIEELTNKPDA